MRRLLLLLLVTAAGCPQIAGERIVQPGTAVEAAFDDDSKDKHYVGYINGDLSPLEGRETSASKHSKIPLTYRGYSEEADQVCFEFEWEGPHQGGEDGLDDAIAKRERAFAGLTMQIEARSTLDDLKDAKWPASPRSDVETARVIDHKLDNEPSVDDATGEMTYSGRLSTRVLLCGRAPRFSDRSKYLTVMSFPNDGSQPAIFVWQIDPPEDNRASR